MDIIVKSNVHKSINEEKNQAPELQVEELGNQNKLTDNKNINELKQNTKEKDVK